MADGGAVGQRRVSAAVEVTRGTTPSSAAFTPIPVSTAQFKPDRGFTQSSLLTNDLEPAAFINGNSSFSGNINSALIAEAGLRLLEESVWSSAYAAVSLASIAGGWTSGTKTFTRTSGSFLTDSLATRLQVGDVCFGSGTTNNQTTLNGAITTTTALTLTLTSATPFIGSTFIKIDSEVMKVVAISTTAVVVLTRGACGTTAATHTNGATVLPGRTITSLTATDLVVSESGITTEGSLTVSFTTTTKRLIPSTTRKILTFEEYFADLAIYRRYMGGEVASMQLTVPTAGEISISAPVVGTQYALTQSSGSPTYASFVGKKAFAGAGGTDGSAAASSSSITKDGVAFPGCIENLTFGVDTGRVPKNGVGEQYACFVEQAARRSLTMSAGIYLVSNAMQTLFHAGTRFAMQYIAVSPDGDKRRFNWPEVVMTDDAEGESGATFIENLTLGIEKDPTEGVSYWTDEVLLS